MTTTITIRNALPELERVHDAILSFLDGTGASREFAEEMFLVAEEVLANTISYGYADDAGHEIELAQSVEGGVFSMRFTDDGAPYDPLARPDPDLDAPHEDRGVGGLGIHLVRTLTDEATYRREADRNILTVGRRLHP
ncbi:MAG: ATP-binding protein [Planctomycetota bacterium]